MRPAAALTPLPRGLTTLPDPLCCHPPLPPIPPQPPNPTPPHPCRSRADRTSPACPTGSSTRGWPCSTWPTMQCLPTLSASSSPRWGCCPPPPWRWCCARPSRPRIERGGGAVGCGLAGTSTRAATEAAVPPCFSGSSAVAAAAVAAAAVAAPAAVPWREEVKEPPPHPFCFLSILCRHRRPPRSVQQRTGIWVAWTVSCMSACKPCKHRSNAYFTNVEKTSKGAVLHLGARPLQSKVCRRLSPAAALGCWSKQAPPCGLSTDQGKILPLTKVPPGHDPSTGPGSSGQGGSEALASARWVRGSRARSVEPARGASDRKQGSSEALEQGGPEAQEQGGLELLEADHQQHRQPGQQPRPHRHARHHRQVRAHCRGSKAARQQQQRGRCGTTAAPWPPA